METSKTGWRALPPALLLAFAIPIAWGLTYVIIRYGATLERGYSPRLIFASEGIGFACLVLAIAGLYELSRRVTGSAATGIKLALAGVSVALGTDILASLVQFTAKPYEHEIVYKLYGWLSPLAWLLVPIGATLALPAHKRWLGIVATIVCFVSWPVPPVYEKMFGWLDRADNSTFVIEGGMRIVRYVLLLATFFGVAIGDAVEDRYKASNGYRLAGKALWLRVISAVFVVLITLMMIGSRGTGGIGLFKFAMMGQGLVGTLSLLLVGLGALAAARSAVPGLSPTTLAIGAAGSLWAAGVSLAQLPYLYRMFYRDGGGGFSRSETMEWAQALSLAVPLIVIVSVGLIAGAIVGVAQRRGDSTLGNDAQSKGLAFVALMFVAVAIQTWVLPESKSMGNFAALSLLAAGAGLAATVMVAKLFERAAVTIESEPGLPSASIVDRG